MEILIKMPPNQSNILQLIGNTGNSYKKAASTNGGEFHGPCPWCGGRDRFSIIPSQDHFVCRSCKKAGDSIFFLRDYHGKTYHEACAALGIDPQISYNQLSAANIHENSIVPWRPRETTVPPQIWQNRAAQVLFDAFKYLISAKAKPIRTWLNERGLTDQTIKQARMGYTPRSLSFQPMTWGVDTGNQGKGLKPKKIWIPEGLIIPYFLGKTPIRLRVRQAHPKTGNRYILVRGSHTGYLHYEKHLGHTPPSEDTRPIMLCESELDGWLLHQELSDAALVMGIGNTTARPDIEAHELLRKRQQIITIFDNDKAGADEREWWSDHYPGRVKHWFMPAGKDPGEAYEFGIDIQKWAIKKLDQSSSRANVHQGEKSFKNVLLKEATKILPVKTQISKKEGPGPKSESHITANPATVKLPIKDLKICLHNAHCFSLQDGQCLVTKKQIWDMEKCPNGGWYKHRETGCISKIIIGAEYDLKRRRKIRF